MNSCTMAPCRTRVGKHCLPKFAVTKLTYALMPSVGFERLYYFRDCDVVVGYTALKEMVYSKLGDHDF